MSPLLEVSLTKGLDESIHLVSISDSHPEALSAGVLTLFKFPYEGAGIGSVHRSTVAVTW